MSPRILRSAALPFLMLIASSAIYAEGGTVFEKTVDVPRDTGVWVEIAYEKVSLMWVATHSAPTDRDVDVATKRDPQDKTPMLVRFHYKNEGYVKQKVDIRVDLLDAKGAVMAHGGRGGSLDGRQKDDTFSFPVIVKTMDWPNAVKMKITATFK
jgi:hypothetical protein